MAVEPLAVGPYRLLRPPPRRSRVAIQATGAGIGAIVGVTVPLVHAGPTMSVDLASQAMLALGFGTISLIAIVFTLLFTIVQWVLGTFSLRLRLFESQSFVWWVLGLCVGVFVYSVVATLMVQGRPDVPTLVPGLTLLGAIATMVLLLRLQLLAFEAVQLTATVQRLTTEGRATIAAVFAEAPGTAGTPLELGANQRSIRWNGELAVLQELDGQQLVDVAERHDTVIEVHTRIGTTVLPGAELARTAGEVPDAEIVRALSLGADRTMSQDPEFALRLLADIALKALSPAINDPATAVQAMEGLETLLVDLAKRNLAVGPLIDSAGTARVLLALPTWEGLVADTLDDLVERSRESPLARRRLEALLGAVIATCRDEDRARVMRARSAALGVA